MGRPPTRGAQEVLTWAAELNITDDDIAKITGPSD